MFYNLINIKQHINIQIKIFVKIFFILIKEKLAELFFDLVIVISIINVFSMNIFILI